MLPITAIIDARRPTVNPETPWADIRALETAGDWAAAIAVLNALNQVQPDVQRERYLVDLRARAFAATHWPVATEPLACREPNHFADTSGIPEISASVLDAAALADGVLGHGALLVRGLVPAEQAVGLAAGIEKTVSRRDALVAGEQPMVDDPWYYPSPYLSRTHKLGVGRKFIADTGGVWAADSPRLLFQTVALYEQLGLPALLKTYLGDTPCLSVRKWVMRRVAPLAGESDWHQDGSFMGTALRSINLWIALTPCGEGTDSPGMDIVPKRLPGIVPTGTHGARFDWTVGPGWVADQLPGVMPVRPRFEAGDALFFDHYNLHRTTWRPDMIRPRYAIESWFFAASQHSEKQIPLWF